MEGHTSRVEYSTAGSSGRRGWVQDFEVISQYTGPHPKQGSGCHRVKTGQHSAFLSFLGEGLHPASCPAKLLFYF